MSQLVWCTCGCLVLILPVFITVLPFLEWAILCDLQLLFIENLTPPYSSTLGLVCCNKQTDTLKCPLLDVESLLRAAAKRVHVATPWLRLDMREGQEEFLIGVNAAAGPKALKCVKVSAELATQ